MPAHMKMPRIKAKMATVTIKSSPEEVTSVFEIPRAALSGFMGTLKKIGKPVKEDSIPADEVFKHLDKKYGRAGAILRGARAKEGLTQEELAGRSGVSVKYIQMLEGKDPNAPTLVKLKELADGFGLQVWKLLKF